jgi:hypothetical protein
MGLDMFLFAVDAAKVGDAQVDVKFAELGIEESAVEELAYWRKHHDLHGWMNNLYNEKGGKDPQFNCNKVRLELEDLDVLEQDIKSRILPETTGFFFGENPPDEESDCYDLDIIKKARQAIESGKAVFYDSWW